MGEPANKVMTFGCQCSPHIPSVCFITSNIFYLSTILNTEARANIPSVIINPFSANSDVLSFLFIVVIFNKCIYKITQRYKP